MIMTDVVLHPDNHEVEIECDNFNIEGHDLLLSSADRLRPSGPVFRRALVHDQNDGLTINYAADYPGGVTVHSDLALSAMV